MDDLDNGEETVVKAMVMTAPGSPEVLQLQDVPIPAIQAETEVLVRLHAAGVNPIDTKLRSRGTFYPDRPNPILGCDGAGVVEAVGSAVTSVRVGDDVYFCDGGLGDRTGNYGEYTVVDQCYMAPKPKNLSFAEAAAAPLVLITAWEALYDRGRLEAGRKIFIQAGAGGVGHVAIQLAKLSGVEISTTVSSDAKATFVKSLGADQVLHYPTTDVVAAVLDWSNGEGVDLAFDTLGGQSMSQCFALTRVYGDVVTLLAPDATTNWKIARDRNLRLSYELMLTPMLQNLEFARRDQANILRHCTRLFEQGDLKIQLSHTFPLAQAADAHRQIETGSTFGKVALIMG
jgi:NADPH2:quinone reductase